MTERVVTIRLGLEDGIGNRLLDIKKQRDALLAKSRIRLNVDASGLEQAQRVATRTQAAAAGTMKDLGALGGAITSKTVPPLAQYQALLGSVLQAGKALGPGLLSSLVRVSAEFQRQRTLAQFWGTSGYMHAGVGSLKSALSGFVATGGAGFTKWLQNTSANLVQYRTALVASAAVMVGMAAAAALSSKHAQNYIQSTLDSRLMARKLSDRAGAETWIQSAQQTDWSAGRESRMATFQSVLSKNPYIGQKGAQKATEDIEKFFFANQEMLQKKGFESAEHLASAVSAPTLTGEDATKFEDIFGLGFQNLTPQARLGRISTEAKDIDTNKAVAARPDVVLTKRLTATTASMGDAVLPVLNTVLGGFIKLSDIIGKIPGLGKAMGWGAVLMGGAAAGLVMVSMIGSLIPGLITVIGLMQKAGVATRLMAAAQWVLNVAMTANPLGIAIMAIVGLIVVLYALEKKFGLVTKAWQAFSGSSVGKGIIGYIEGGKKALGDMLAMLGNAYKSGGLGGVLKIALGALIANDPMLKMIVFIVDFLRKLWTNSTILNKIMATGMALWQRMVDFFTWLFEAIKSGVQIIKNGLGITKKEAESKYESAVKTSGGIRYYDEENKKGWYDSQGKQVSEDQVPAYLAKAFKEYQDSPGSIIEGLWAWLVGIFQKLIDAITGLPGNISAAIKTWFPGAGGSQDKGRSPAENDFGAKIEAKAPGAYVKGPNDTQIPPSQWPMQYLADRTGTFGSKTVYGPGGAELGTVQSLGGSKEAAMDALLQAAKMGGKPSDTPGIRFNEDTWLELFKGMGSTYPNAQELYDRLVAGTEGAAIKADRFGNEYLSPTAPETFKNQGGMYVAFGDGGLFDVENASGKVKRGFGSEQEAKEYIKTHSMAKGGQIRATGSLIGHGGEEMDPAMVVQGGKTTLARINDLFRGGDTYQGGQSITVHAPVTVSIGKVEKDVDVDRLITRIGREGADNLLFHLRNALEGTNHRGVSYERG